MKRALQVPVSPSPSASISHQGRRVTFRSQSASHRLSVPRTTTGVVASATKGREESDLDDSMETEDALEGIRLLSLQSNQQRIAASFYDGARGVLSIVEDTEDSKSFDMAKNRAARAVMAQLAPNAIIANTRSSEDLLQAIHDHCESHDCTYQIRPQKDYWIAGSTARLARLRVRRAPPLNSIVQEGSESHAMDQTSGSSSAEPVERRTMASIDLRFDGEEHFRQMRLARLGCYMNLNADLAIGTAGALIAQLDRHAKLITSGDDGERLSVEVIELVKLEEHMYINADSLVALSIFDEEDHASMHSKRTKEGLSLFGIMNTCSTKMGASQLRRWFLRPLLSLDEIHARHDAVATLLRADNNDLADLMRGTLKRIKNVQRSLTLLQAGPVPWTVWKSLTDFIFAALEMKNLTQQMVSWEAVVILQQISAVVSNETLGELGRRIANLFDWDASRDQNEVVIRPDADQAINQCHERLTNLEATLTDVAGMVIANMSRESRAELQNLNVVTFPQMGFLIAAEVPRDAAYPDTWEFRFTSENVTYFKDEMMVDLDEGLGDLQGILTDRTIELVEDLREIIVEKEAVLLAVADICAELDCLLALALFARTSSLVRPAMRSDDVIIIQDGRHLLHEEGQREYVPNHTVLGALQTDETGISSPAKFKRAAKAMLISGANGSGKSAYAKQVALIVFMAQIGSFVPARAASLGAVDKIFTRLHTRETVGKQASSFMIDLSQVSLALRGATARSLIVLDEFGKGTDPRDGTSLLAGVLTHLLAKGISCPHVIAITHFHELVAKDLLPRNTIDFFEMVAAHAPGSDELVFTYNLEPSSAVTSYAFECALHQGIAPEIVERARFASDRIATYEAASLLEDVLLEKKDTRNLLFAEHLTRQFLSWNLQAPMDQRENVLDGLKAMLISAGKPVPDAEGEEAGTVDNQIDTDQLSSSGESQSEIDM